MMLNWLNRLKVFVRTQHMFCRMTNMLHPEDDRKRLQVPFVQVPHPSRSQYLLLGLGAANFMQQIRKDLGNEQLVFTSTHATLLSSLSDTIALWPGSSRAHAWKSSSSYERQESLQRLADNNNHNNNNTTTTTTTTTTINTTTINTTTNNNNKLLLLLLIIMIIPTVIIAIMIIIVPGSSRAHAW